MLVVLPKEKPVLVGVVVGLAAVLPKEKPEAGLEVEGEELPKEKPVEAGLVAVEPKLKVIFWGD